MEGEREEWWAKGSVEQGSRGEMVEMIRHFLTRLESRSRQVSTVMTSPQYSMMGAPRGTASQILSPQPQPSVDAPPEGPKEALWTGDRRR